MKRLITVLFVLTFFRLSAQEIVKVEYFIDNDPGYGKAIPVSFTNSDLAELDFNIPLNTIKRGFHILHIRAMDENGKWSTTLVHQFINQSLQNSPLRDITDLEYFINEDPGIGKATQAGVPHDSIQDLSFDLGLLNLKKSFNTFYLRAKDEYGNWGQTYNWQFIVSNSQYDPLPGIEAIEYFFNEDPGFEKGAVFPVLPEGQNNISQTIFADVSELEEGYNTFYIRIKDINNNWSLVHADTFKICLTLPEIELGETDTITVDEAITLDAGFGFTAYKWNNGFDERIMELTGSELGVGKHKFWVTITDIENCSNYDTIQITVHDPVGLNDFDPKKEIKIFPNPIKGGFYFKMPETINDKINLEIINICGQTILRKSLRISKEELQFIDLSKHPKGIYLLRIKAADKIINRKLFVE
jgi:hypothetical protein